MRQFARNAWLTIPLFAFSAVHAGQRLQFVERAAGEVITHLNKGTDSPGDLLTFVNPVFDAANQEQVARDQGFCIRVAVGKNFECFWTLIMPAGQITLEGPLKIGEGASHYAVTGGTGQYAGAKGSVASRPRDAKAGTYDLTYELL